MTSVTSFRRARPESPESAFGVGTFASTMNRLAFLLLLPALVCALDSVPQGESAAQEAPDSTASTDSVKTAEPVHDTVAPAAEAFAPAKLRNADSLSERSSWLKVRSRYSASVILDGSAVGDLLPDDSALGTQPICIWRSGSLTPGPHHVRVEADLCTPWESTVDLPAGRATSVEARIDWTPEEKARRHRARLKGPRIVLGIGAALSSVFILSNSNSLQAAKDQAASAEADMAAATIQRDQYNSRVSKAHSDADDARTNITVGIVLASLCAAGFGATWVF